MKVISVILCFLVSCVSSKGCNLPPSTWCTTPEIAELCQATEACREYLFPAAQAPKVNISLYYESLCPYSMAFIMGQASKAYNKVGSIMNLEMIPFGNAVIKTDGGVTSFKCQHGPMECEANLVETCAISILPPTEVFPFIFCVTKEFYRMPFPFYAYKACAKSMKLNIKPIMECAVSERGMILEKVMANKTNSLKPPKTYVPWIVVNGVHTEDLNNQAQSDLVGLVCRTYKGSDKPAACKKSYSVTMDTVN